ncbi:MAG TPA: hypothetical protein VEI97_04975, partial [bacterium]|nr:hypothetical protein [bacterium]
MIPLANLYYLLCYAWNLLPATHLAPTASEPLPPDANPALSLLTHLLTASLRRQPQGPQVRYHPVTSSGPTLRGRLLLDQLARDPGATIAQRLPARHDELTADTPLNRLLAT